MGFLFGSKRTQSTGQTVASGLTIQSSVYGQVIPLLYGTTRDGNNLLWYGDFVASQQSSGGGGGGKGGIGGGGGGKGGGGSVTYTYSTSVAMALCEGPIYGVPTVYANKNVTTPAQLNMSVFDGSYPQTPWGYLTTNHPGEDLGYNGIAYVAVAGMNLGNSPQLPNHNFVVQGVLSQSVLYNGAVLPDADPSLVLVDLLTNPHYGAGFPASLIGDLSQMQNFCLAANLLISPSYTNQTQTSSLLDDLMKATNCAMVWSNGLLNVYSYGDQQIVNPLIQPAGGAQGVTYNPPAAPEFDLTDDDFMPSQGGAASSSSSGVSDPVIITRKRPADAYNSIKIEYLNSANQYNPAVAEVKDQASIDQYGLRQDSVRQMHLFCQAAYAQTSAQLQLQREQIRNQYSFTLDQRYILLDPMDIVTLTDSRLGLNKQWVRITEITENDDFSLSMIAEDYLYGTGTAALYGFQTGSGFSADYNTEAPNPNLPPILFEPTAELAEELAVWMAISGPPLWGGAQVWLSTDQNNYKLAGTVTGSCRTGVLTADLATVTPSVIPPTIDQANTLSIDLSQSEGQLSSGSQSDALNLSTLCWVDGEYIAYQNADLTGTETYDLTYLVRGAYDSTIGAHAAGSQFARLDGNVFHYPYASNLIGTTIYIKFLSFNIYGGGLQTLSEVNPIAYTLQGTAFTSPLPDVQNLRTVYVGSLAQLDWDPVTDFRPILYEIRQGASWDSAVVLGRIAAGPFNVPGNGTYWVSAYSNPYPGIQVYSLNPSEIIISGSSLVSNVIATFDEATSGWPGTTSGSLSVSGGNLLCAAGGSGYYTLATGDFLGESDFLGITDFLAVTNEEVNIGRIAACGITITTAGFGNSLTDDFLGVGDFLGQTDFLDAAASKYIYIEPQVSVSQDGTTFSDWQKYSPGFYLGMVFRARLFVQSNSPTVQAVVTDMVFSVDVPDRTDHITDYTLSSGGTTFTFTPDGTMTAAAFNGGPNGATVPNIQVTILNATAGDEAFITALTLSNVTVQVKNAGSGVARHINLIAQGF